MNTVKDPLMIAKQQDIPLIGIQYMMLVESINQLNNARETSNYFWVTANSIVVTALSYSNTLSDLTSINKTTFGSSLFFIGYLICLIWASYLNTLRKKIQLHYDKLIQVEKCFSIKLFQDIYAPSGKENPKNSLSFKELLVPILFMSTYTLLIINFYYEGKIFQSLAINGQMISSLL